MPTDKQVLGENGELLVVKNCFCPKCKKINTLKRLPTNFKCADIICDFCGYLAQVKASKSKNINLLPSKILGAAWGVQKDRLDSSIYIPLFIVLYKSRTEFGIYYLSADLQVPELFSPRKPLSETAKRAGWQGFMYDLSKLKGNSIVRLL
jgi:type II restriction enzyme